MKKLLLVLFFTFLVSCSDDPTELLILSRSNLKSGSYETARYNLEKLIKIDSTHQEAYMLMGKMEFELTNLKEAVKHYDKVIEINPQYIAAYKERAKVNRRLGLSAQAIKDLTYLLSIYSSDGSIYLERANVYFEMDIMDSACQDWKMAYELGEMEADRIYQKFCVEIE
jgi:tetratricopeptide (TPR) repeat protein